MDLVIKVADFGLSVNTDNKDYYRITGDMGIKLPLKWMAPESLTDYVFSEMSDVVSYLLIISTDSVAVHYWFPEPYGRSRCCDEVDIEHKAIIMYR